MEIKTCRREKIPIKELDYGQVFRYAGRYFEKCFTPKAEVAGKDLEIAVDMESGEIKIFHKMELITPVVGKFEEE